MRIAVIATVRRFGLFSVAISAVLSGVVCTPAARSDTCPDVHVVFARGTGESPGVGWVGQTFIDKLKTKLAGKTVTAYGVNYPAGWDFTKSASAGAADANAHIRSAVAVCPQTKLVLGGMSQGSGVIDLITVGSRPIWFFTPSPLPSGVADHVAAVAVFGNPSRDYPMLGPLTSLSPDYGPKSIDQCAPGDPICSNGLNYFAHLTYPWSGMVDQAADFAASQVVQQMGAARTAGLPKAVN